MTATGSENVISNKPLVIQVNKEEIKKNEKNAKPDIQEVAEVPATTPKVVTSGVKEVKSRYQHKTTSIKDGLKGSFGIEKKSDTAEVPENGKTKILENPFSINDLQEHWLGYSESIKKDKPRLATTLRTQLPTLEDNFRIIVKMENANQQEDFQRYLKFDILGFLKNKLNNDKIVIDTILAEVDDSDNKPYTDEEKFKFMSEKNSNLKTLKQQFGLDFE